MFIQAFVSHLFDFPHDLKEDSYGKPVVNTMFHHWEDDSHLLSAWLQIYSQVYEAYSFIGVHYFIKLEEEEMTKEDMRGWVMEI